MSNPSFIELYNVDKKICDDLIEYHEKNTLYKDHGYVGIGSKYVMDKSSKESIDVTFHNDTKHKAIINFFKELKVCLDQYTNKYLIKNGLATAYRNVISMFPPLGGFKIPHYERASIEASRRQLVYMLYLNTVKDGGDTEFIHQNIITKAEKGTLVLWPADFTHLHRGIVSPTEIKYIATGWLEVI